MIKLTRCFVLAIFSMLIATGCSTAYYKTMEAFGQDKRDIFANRIDSAKESQTEAQEVFKDALEQFTSVTNYDGGNLEKIFRKLESRFEDSTDAANKVTQRVDDVQNVAEDLFDEWEKELNLYTDKSLRQRSKDQLVETKRNYVKLLKTMRSAERSMAPVLNKFRDHVLYLKHNLNAQAIASLDDSVPSLRADVNGLVAQMESSILEAQEFMKQLK